jgi:hypothetical protein
MHFALVIWMLIGGQPESFIIDHNLTYEDCTGFVETYQDDDVHFATCELEL